MNARVAHILDEIRQLSPEEQRELTAALPGVVRRQGERHGLTVEAVRQAIETRERIREEMLAEGQEPGSTLEDLDTVREERLRDLDATVSPPHLVS